MTRITSSAPRADIAGATQTVFGEGAKGAPAIRAPGDVRAQARQEFYQDIGKVAEYVRSVASGHTSSRAKRGA